ncbi:MAG: hypothetical protein K6F37_02375, partial [Lachnospiraceae bacterium]|nr:hypothetical protein [Lachnospiraceae bacterium]
MKNLIKKMALAVIALAVVVVLAPATAQAKLTVPSSIEMYAGNSGYISLDGVKSIKKITDIKSSDKSVVYVTEKSAYTNEYEGLSYKGKGSSGSGSLYLYAPKTGTATVSFKVSGKSYSTKVTVLAYSNPLKSFKINGKEVASKFKKSSYVNAKKLKKTVKNFKISAKPASGWKITNIRYYDSKDYLSAYMYGDNLSGRTL